MRENFKIAMKNYGLIWMEMINVGIKANKMSSHCVKWEDYSLWCGISFGLLKSTKCDLRNDVRSLAEASCKQILLLSPNQLWESSSVMHAQLSSAQFTCCNWLCIILINAINIRNGKCYVWCFFLLQLFFSPLGKS